MIPLAPTDLDRLWTTFRALIRAELPELSFLGSYEYVVTATDGTNSTPAKTVDCKPTDPALSLPSINRCPIRMPYGVTPPTGAICVVQFLNGDPSKGFVTNFVDPMTLLVFANGKLPNARQGDMVAVSISPQAFVQFQAGYVPSPFNPVPLPTIVAAAAIPGAPMPVPPGPITLYGIVSSGNPQVKS